MLLYFALDDEDTCFHSSKIFNNLEDLYKELMDYRNNVHFVYSVSLFVYDTVSNKECSIVIIANDITSLSFDVLKSYVDIFTTYHYKDDMVVTSIKCDIVGDGCGNFGYDYVTVTFDDGTEVRW